MGSQLHTPAQNIDPEPCVETEIPAPIVLHRIGGRARCPVPRSAAGATDPGNAVPRNEGHGPHFVVRR
jgi:hypothetical protein